METSLTSLKISNKNFEKLSIYILQNYGINLTSDKKKLVENRLCKKVISSEFGSLDEYLEYIFSLSGKDELSLISDLLSTNKTYFYREPAHFLYFEKFLKSIEKPKKINLWSVACSSGDEVYTLSAILHEHLSKINNSKKGLVYSILGTDISSKMIQSAKLGEYDQSRLLTLPKFLIQKYFTKEQKQLGEYTYKVHPTLKRNISFKYFNLIKDFPLNHQQYDIIFCRNVLIYFLEETKIKVVQELIKRLKPGGLLFLGHCEGFLCQNTELIQIQPSIFKKPENE